jgi:hypothetical protein
VLDDAPWPRVIRVHRDQAGDLALFQNQADRWKTDPGLTDAQRTEVAAYEKLIAQLREINSEVLAVAAELSHGTIETVLASRAATARLLPPCAHASTIRARKTRPCAVLRRLTQFSNLRRSSSDSTSGSSPVSPIPPADPNRQHGDSPQPGTGTQHDSRGDRETQHRLTRGQLPPPRG